MTNVKSITAGDSHSVALKEDGTVVAWGLNDNGQCNVPAGTNNIKQLAASKNHTLALKEDGTVVAWGDNSDGQCDVPRGLKDVKSIAACYNSSFALKNDGTIVYWGAKSVDYLKVPEGIKDGDLNQHYIPEGLKNIKQVSAGMEHTLVLKNDGSIYSPQFFFQ